MESFLNHLNAKYQASRSREDIYMHDMSVAFGISKENHDDLITKVLQENEWKLVNGFYENFGKIAHHEIHIFTARTQGYEAKTSLFLSEKGIRFDSFHNIRHPKYIHIDSHFDIFIEDDLKEAINLSTCSKKIYLLNYPWNQTVENNGLDHAFTRVDNWTDLITRIEDDFPGSTNI